MLYKVVVMLLILAVLGWAVCESARDPPNSHRIGFDPDYWGPHLWLILHIQALNTARDFGSSSRNFEKYLICLQKVLPCKECRDEMGLIIDTVPPREFLMFGRIGCVAYMYVMHCCVSDRLKGVHCRVRFLDEEERFLREYVRPGGVDVLQVMTELRQDAEERGVFHLIEDAQIKLRRMLRKRELLGKDPNHF